MINKLIHNFIRGLKPFTIISLIVGLFIGIVSLAILSDVFWWFCMTIIIIGFICGLGSTRNNK